MKNPQINQRIIYAIFALVGIGFLTALYFSIYRAPNGEITLEVSGLIEEIDSQKLKLKKQDESFLSFVITKETIVRIYNNTGNYEIGSISDLTKGQNIIAGGIANNTIGYIDVYLQAGERGGIIESITENTISIKSETHGMFDITIDDNLTYIRTIDSVGRFIPGNRTDLSVGKSIILIAEDNNGLATWIEVYPSKNFNKNSDNNEE